MVPMETENDDLTRVLGDESDYTRVLGSEPDHTRVLQDGPAQMQEPESELDRTLMRPQALGAHFAEPAPYQAPLAQPVAQTAAPATMGAIMTSHIAEYAATSPPSGPVRLSMMTPPR